MKMKTKRIALVFIMVAIVIAFFWWCFKKIKDSGNRDYPSLYSRLGGIFPISQIINDFSDALINNPVVGKRSKNKLLAEWNQNQSQTRLSGLKFMRTLWLCSITGGPYNYVPSVPGRKGKCPFSLENAHSQLQISGAEFDEVASVLNKTLDKYNVGNPEKNEVLAAFAAHKPDILQGYDIANDIAVPVLKC